MAKNMLMEKYQTHKISISASIPSPINLSDNKHNHIIEVLPKKDKTNRSVKTRKVNKSIDNPGKAGKRIQKCARCTHHELNPPLVKGHKRKCKYGRCSCKLCKLTAKKQKISKQIIYEIRKINQDIEDGTHRFIEPVFKNEGLDDYLSETDDESTNTEDNSISKIVNLKKEACKYFENICKLYKRNNTDESPEDVGRQALDWFNDIVRQQIETKNTINLKTKVSKQESTDQSSSMKSEDSNDLDITSTLTPRRTPIPSPTTSSTHSVESLPDNYPLIRRMHSPHNSSFLMPYNGYNILNYSNLHHLMYEPKVLSQYLSQHNSLTTTSQIYNSFRQYH